MQSAVVKMFMAVAYSASLPWICANCKTVVAVGVMAARKEIKSILLKKKGGLHMNAIELINEKEAERCEEFITHI